MQCQLPDCCGCICEQHCDYHVLTVSVHYQPEVCSAGAGLQIHSAKSGTAKDKPRIYYNDTALQCILCSLKMQHNWLDRCLCPPPILTSRSDESALETLSVPPK